VENLRTLRLVPAPSEEPTPSLPIDFESLFRSYARYVAGVAFRILGRDGDLDDVVQDVFVRAIKGLKRCDHPAELKSWLATVTVRVASRRLRQRRLRQWLSLDDAPNYENVAGPQASGEERLFLQRVFTVLDDLPVSARVAWVLRYLEGEPLEVVARQCDCSLATAKRRIAHAQAEIERRVAADE
jgi:RNA polymerase sigma-70 factor (ECF subfamily)